ncbi:MAG: PQQ-dependent dehydrogenase, methanol/ethanol family, partial [Hyphomicrobiales bacterium]|nr:PQQ-dependent dehydrogenase, methanol/ethanol family [Hyphomicrobiales bacterium]
MKRSGIILAVIAAVAGAAGIYSWQSQRGGFAEGSPPVRGTASPSTTIGQITDARIQNANAEPGLWLAHGRDYSEQRHSPLTRITRSNVRQLGLAWSFDMYATRALEATPIVVDGIMYMTG